MVPTGGQPFIQPAVACQRCIGPPAICSAATDCKPSAAQAFACTSPLSGLCRPPLACSLPALVATGWSVLSGRDKGDAYAGPRFAVLQGDDCVRGGPVIGEADGVPSDLTTNTVHPLTGPWSEI